MLAAVVLAFALATDAATAAAVRGLMAARVRVRDALLVALLTGGFQAGMAALGWLGGRSLGERFAQLDHWIAFGLLAGLGVRAIASALRARDGDEAPATGDAFRLGPLLLLALATSVDALAAGVTVPLLGPPPVISLALIGGVTFALAFAATYAGRLAGAQLGRKLELLGGVALIALGTKILIEHLA